MLGGTGRPVMRTIGMWLIDVVWLEWGYGAALELSQSVSQLFHGPAPRSPLHRLAVRLRHSRSNTSTEYSLPGATHVLNCRK